MRFAYKECLIETYAKVSEWGREWEEDFIIHPPLKVTELISQFHNNLMAEGRIERESGRNPKRELQMRRPPTLRRNIYEVGE